jgi:hypothetical protein
MQNWAQQSGGDSLPHLQQRQSVTNNFVRHMQRSVSAPMNSVPSPTSGAVVGESMPFYRVLEEEYRALHPEDAASDGADADTLRWNFSSNQILDAQDLARRLNEPLLNVRDARLSALDGEDMAVLVLGNDAGLTAALKSYIDANRPYAGPTTEAFKAALVERLNAMLQDANLRTTTVVQALPLNAYVTELRNQKQPLGRQMSEANRLFLESAFPTQLQRMRDLRLNATYAKIRGKGHKALCLSGGGIRSATFALGFVQGLARADMLVDFDYLSTVSGGGYMGGWLSSWMQHAGPAYVQAQLRKSPTAKLDPEPVPVKHLRAFASFLSPKLGLLSADTWTLVATYLRNVLLNWLVILPLVAMVVLVPWVCNAVVGSQDYDWGWMAEPQWNGIRPIIAALYALGFITGVIAVAYVHRDEPPTVRDANGRTRRMRKEQSEFLVWCLGPLVTSGVLLTTGWALSWKWDLQPINDAGYRDLKFFTATGALLHLVGWLFALRWSAKNKIIRAVAITISGALIGALSYLVARQLTAATPALYSALAMPGFLLLLLLGGQIYLGISSRWNDDGDREWGARFNAWIFIVIVSWAAFSTIILFGPSLVLHGYRALTALGIGTVSGVATLLLGGSSKTGNSQAASAKQASSSIAGKMAKLALALAAPVFALSIIIGISAIDAWMLNGACKIEGFCQPYFGTLNIVDAPGHPHAWTVVLLMLALLAAGLGFGWLIDTNDFSLNAMYRARLIRAYLGASRPAGERNPDPFTGFDKGDDILMKDLWPAAGSREHGSECAAAKTAAEQREQDSEHQPLHVVNVTLNLVAGENLAWQERKAESFTMTPLHAGSAYLGYRRTSPKEVRDAASTEMDDTLFSGGQLSLGTAVTISGAAASPNMGYHTSSIIAFLMTLFNARLGAWFGNPGPAGEKTFNLAHPRLAIKPILAELFALSNDRSDYVYLSDGGHFENLALYEMVLRRCRYIVVSDASADGGCSFEDLGNAIRKIRIDMGVPIDFDEGLDIYPRSSEPPKGAKHWAFGKIRYSCVDKPAASEGVQSKPDSDYDGVLIYVKPTFYGVDEPRDVYNYAQSSPTFPHESTADQFFSESQFESYRALGSFIADELCATEEFVGVMNGG